MKKTKYSKKKSITKSKRQSVIRKRSATKRQSATKKRSVIKRRSATKRSVVKRRSAVKRRSKRSKRARSKSKVRIPIIHKGALGKYHIDLPEKKRRSILKNLLSKGEATYSEIIKRLNVLVIYNKRRYPETSRKAKRDLDFIQRQYTN